VTLEEPYSKLTVSIVIVRVIEWGENFSIAMLGSKAFCAYRKNLQSWPVLRIPKIT